MKVWLLENGERTGPHESFEIRDRIESGELKEDTQAWYEGAEGWVRLDEVPLFSSLFGYVEEDDEISEILQPPPLPTVPEEVMRSVEQTMSAAPPLYMLRRLFARLHDSYLYMCLMLWGFQDVAVWTLEDGGLMRHVLIGLAYVVFDGLMIHLWKCSPGKWLLGIRTVDAQGHAIPLGYSLLRSLRVWVLGMGMGVVTFIAMCISGFMARRFGYFLWDLPRRYRVVAKPFSSLFPVRYILSLFFITTVLISVLPPEMIEEINKHSPFRKLAE